MWNNLLGILKLILLVYHGIIKRIALVFPIAILVMALIGDLLTVDGLIVVSAYVLFLIIDLLVKKI